MNSQKNNQIVKPVSKVVKVEQCQCGKSFDFPRYVLIYCCQDCLNSHRKTVPTNQQIYRTTIMNKHNLVLNYNFSSKEDNFTNNSKRQYLTACAKCLKGTNCCPWIGREGIWPFSKHYQQWLTIKAKHYRRAVQEFSQIGTDKPNKEKKQW